MKMNIVEEQLAAYNRVKKKTGAVESSCSCKDCKAMCKSTPCIGTPEDIVRIVDAGYSDKLATTTWCAGIIAGIPPIEMIAPLYIEGKGCAFLNDDGLCSLHDIGLKPTEGKLSLSQHHKEYLKHNIPVAFIVALSWVKVNLNQK